MPIQLFILLSIFISFIIVFYSIPKIIYISHVKKLFDIPNERSASQIITPNLGGIAIFAGFYISSIITLNGFDINKISYLLLASLIMFLVGLKDDIIGLSPLKKLSAQFFTAIYLVLPGEICIRNLHGILGLHEISLLPGALLSMVAIIGIINAYNLIDGVDGLASGIGILMSIVFGTLFILDGQIEYSIVSFSLTGSLIAFFYYNVFGTVNKIFMGDTGSLVLGVVFSFLAIKYVQMGVSQSDVADSPTIALAILIVPVIDTIRVMIIRIAKKKSPLSADMNHIHHQLLRLTNNNHLHTSLIIIFTNLVFIGFAFGFLEILGNNLLFFVLITAGFSVAYIPVWANKKKSKLIKGESHFVKLN